MARTRRIGAAPDVDRARSRKWRDSDRPSARRNDCRTTHAVGARASRRRRRCCFPRRSVNPRRARHSIARSPEPVVIMAGGWSWMRRSLSASGILAPVPGPNVLAYYLGFRLVGHWLSWRGARHAIGDVQWTLEPDGSLAELASLVNMPRAARASRVDAIAARLESAPALRIFRARRRLKSACYTRASDSLNVETPRIS